MAYTKLPTRTTADSNNAADVNQLQGNIEALKGGTATAAPISTIAALYATLANYGQSVTVDGVAKTLYFKTISGTLDSDSETAIIHGLDSSKILSVVGKASAGGSIHYFFQAVGSDQWYCSIDNTYAYFTNVAAQYQSQPYKITFMYHS